MPTDTGLRWVGLNGGAGGTTQIDHSFYSFTWPAPGSIGSSMIRLVGGIRCLHVPPSVTFMSVNQFAPMVAALAFQTLAEASGSPPGIDDFDQDWLFYEPIAWQDYEHSATSGQLWQIGTFASGLLDIKIPRTITESDMFLKLVLGEPTGENVVGPFRDNLSIAVTLRILTNG